MHPALLAFALAVADPLGFPSPPAVAALPAPAPSTPAAPTASTPPLARTAAPTLSLPASTGPGLDALILPVAVLLALAIAALLLGRRKQKASRLVQVLETTSIGPKRALVVARVGDELLVIGSSEAGLQLLAARPAGLELRTDEAGARLAAVPDPTPEAAPGGGKVLGLLSRLTGRSAAGLTGRSAAGLTGRSAAGLAGRSAAGLVSLAGAEADREPTGLATFDALLAESAEDQELRRKLAQGHTGSVR
jgi:hypothetical protein